MENVINFSDFNKKRVLSDEDIKSLFLGLVGLIKTSAQEDLKTKFMIDAEEKGKKLQTTLLELKIKNEIICELKSENEKLKSKTKILEEKINSINVFKRIK